MKLIRQVATVCFGIIAWSTFALAAGGGSRLSNLPSRPGSAEGELTVTLTVMTSVGVVMDENGQPKIIVANAPDPADNVSSLQIVRAAGQKKKTNK